MNLIHKFLLVFFHHVFYECIHKFLLVTIIEKDALLIFEYEFELNERRSFFGLPPEHLLEHSLNEIWNILQLVAGLYGFVKPCILSLRGCQ